MRKNHAPPPAPAPPAGNTSKMGYNLSILDYWVSSHPFLDISKQGGGWYPFSGTTTGYNAGGWPILAAGAVTQRDVAYALDNEYGYYPPGDYELVTTDPNMWIIPPAVYNGVSASTPGLGRATCTLVSAAHNWGDAALKVKVRNDNGSTTPLTNLVFRKISDAPAMAAGEIFIPGYAAAHAPCKVIRIHDFFYTDNPDIAWLEKYTMLPGVIGGEGTASYINGRMPPSIGMKFAKKVQEFNGGREVRPWINVPCGIKQFWFMWFSDTNKFVRVANEGYTNFPLPENGFIEPTIVPHNLVDGEQIVLPDLGSGQPPAIDPIVTGVVYYVVQSGDGTGFKLSATLGGAPIVGTGTGSTFHGATTWGTLAARAGATAFVRMCSLAVDPYNDMILPFLTACHAAWPECRPMVEPGGENWNSGFPVRAFVNDVAARLAGSSGTNNVAGHAYLQRLVWKAAKALWGDGNFTIVHGGHGSWFDEFAGSFEQVDTLGLLDPTHTKTLKQQYIDALATPGWGPTDTIPACMYATAAYAANSAFTAANWPDAGIGYNVLQYLYDTYGGPPPAGWWDERFDQEINDLASVLAADISVTVGARSKVPNMPFGMYEAGQQVASTGSAGAALVGRDFIDNYLDQIAGANMYGRLWAMLAPFNMYVTCHLEAVGGRFCSPSAFYAWNLVPPTLLDTPRSALLKTL